MRSLFAATMIATLAIATGLAWAAHGQERAVGRWQVGPATDAPGSCTARLNGAAVDLIVLINNTGKLVLVAGHPGWNATGSVQTMLSIDGGAPSKLAADAVGPLVMALVDDARTAALRKARSIDWTLPPGRFHVSVEGLGAAMDAVRACQHA